MKTKRPKPVRKKTVSYWIQKFTLRNSPRRSWSDYLSFKSRKRRDFHLANYRWIYDDLPKMPFRAVDRTTIDVIHPPVKATASE